MSKELLESDTKKSIKKYLNSKNIPFWMVIPSAYGKTTGVSDFIAILPNGKWLAIEAKAPHRKTEKNSGATSNQLKFLQAIIDNNGVGMVVCDEEDIVSLSRVVEAAL